MPENRNVNVALNVGLGPQGDKALRDLQRSIEAASKSQERLQQSAAAVFSPLITNPAGGRGGATGAGLVKDERGFGSAVGSALGRYVAPIMVAHTALETAKFSALAVHDPYITGGQIERQGFRQLAPFGGTVQDLVDAFSGRAAKMQQVDIASKRRDLENQFQDQFSRFTTSYAPRQAGREEAARQAAGFGGIYMPRTDRTTAGGEIQFQEQSKLIPVRREIARLEREAAVAVKERNAAESNFADLTRRSLGLEQTRARLTAQVRADQGAGPERQAMLRELNDVENQLKRLAEARQQAAEAVAQSREKAGAAGAAVTKARAEEAETRAEIFESRAARSAGRAKQLGLMSPIERQQALQALELAQKYGLDYLPPELKQQALALAPETVGKLAETQGALTPEFRRAQELAPAEFGEKGTTPEDLRQEAAKAREEAESLRVQAEQQFTSSAEAAGRDLAMQIRGMMKTFFDAMKRQIEIDIQTANNLK